MSKLCGSKTGFPEKAGLNDDRRNALETHDNVIIQEINRQQSASRASLRRWLFIAGLALAAHEPAYHPAVREGFREYVLDPYHAWQEANKKREIEESLESSDRNALENDRKQVQERNAERLIRVKAREAQAKEFKADVYRNYAIIPFKDIFFPVEYFDQGSGDEEKSAAQEYFEIIVDGVQVEDPAKPQYQESKKLVSVLMPAGSYDRTKSSATTSLFEKLGEKSQNCVARTRLMVMAVARKYPEMRKQIFVQKFGDHERALIEIGGKRFILEGDVAEFPDAETKEKKNEVMPFEVWLALYGGHKRSEFEGRIEKHGPRGADRKKKQDYPRVTDDLVPEDFWDGDLDNVGSVQSWFASGNDGGGNDRVGGAGEGDAGAGEGGQAYSQKEDQSEKEKPGNILDSEEPELKMTVNKPVLPDQKRWDFETITVRDAETFKRQAQTQSVTVLQFPNLKKLDAASAKALATKYEPMPDFITKMEFDAPVEMDEAAAYELSKFKGILSFGGFPQLPVSLMKGLFFHDGGVHFKTKIASAEALEAFVGKKPGSSLIGHFFDLKELLPENADSNFDVSAAGDSNVQPRYRGQLSLEGVVGLSVEAAEVLGRFNGVLHFNRVPFSAAAAEKLAQNPSQILIEEPLIEGLTGLKNYTNFISISLKVPPERLIEFARAVVDYKGELAVGIRGGGKLTVEAARIFGKRKGHLSFHDQFTDISDEALGELASQEGILQIGGVPKTLSLETAKKLSKHKGILKLNHIAAMAPGAAAYLVQVFAQGPAWSRELSLHSLKEVTPEMAEAFGRFKGFLILDSVRTITPEVARFLARHEGELALGLTTLSPEVLRELIHHKGKVSINNVGLITLEMAKVLSRTTTHFLLYKAQVRSKRAAKLLHPKRYLIQINDIAGLRINAPDRPEINWEED